MSLKRLIIPALCTLLLAGCGCSSFPEEPEGIAPASFFPESSQETFAGGAVECIPLPEAEDWTLYAMGENLLLAQTENESVRLTALSGAALTPLGSLEPENESDIRRTLAASDSAGAVWYDRAAGTLRLLNPDMTEAGVIPMPESVPGVPCLSPDRQYVYYSANSRICALDTKSGLRRVVMEAAPDYQAVSCLMDGRALYCRMAGPEDPADNILISAEDGSILWRSQLLPEMAYRAERWYAASRSPHQQIVVGGAEEQQVLNVGPERVFLNFLPELESAVTYVYRQDSSSLTLELFHLASGCRTAQVTLEGFGPPEKAVTNGEDIFMTVYDEADTPVLLRWKPDRSAVSDTQTYLEPFFTREKPDLAGLCRCQAQADAIAGKHGIRILIHTAATAMEPWDYDLEPEYLVPELSWELEKLDSLLDAYPEGFLADLSQSSGGLTICLVRSIRGRDSAGSIAGADGLQFRESGSSYLALAVGTATQYNLYHELTHLIDTRVLNTCRAYDDWDSLNPVGFSYDYDYEANLHRDGSQWLQPESRAFIDTYSMSFPTEDRARIMEFAMNEGNDYLFQSPVMQEKLKTLCIGIRQSFGLTQAPEIFRWEQYLIHSLAYRKW